MKWHAYGAKSPRKQSVVAIIGGLAVGLLCIVVLGVLDHRPRSIEQRPGTGEVDVAERVNGVLARFDRVVVVRVGLGVVGEPSVSDSVLGRISATPRVKIPLKLVE